MIMDTAVNNHEKGQWHKMYRKFSIKYRKKFSYLHPLFYPDKLIVASCCCSCLEYTVCPFCWFFFLWRVKTKHDTIIFPTGVWSPEISLHGVQGTDKEGCTSAASTWIAEVDKHMPGPAQRNHTERFWGLWKALQPFYQWGWTISWMGSHPETAWWSCKYGLLFIIVIWFIRAVQVIHVYKIKL